MSACILDARSQPSGYEMVHHYTTENGLPQNSITGLAEDKDGFIWIGTQSGLVRFDGNNLKVFNTFDIDPKSTNRISGLAYYNNRLMAEDKGLKKNLLEIKSHNVILKVPDDSQYLSALTNSFHSLIPQPYFNYENYGTALEGDLFIGNDGREGYTYGFHPAATQLFYFNTQSGKSSKQVLDCPGRKGHFFLIGSRLYAFDSKNVFYGTDRTTPIKSISGSFITMLDGLSESEKNQYLFAQAGENVFYYNNNRVYLIKELAPGNIEALLLTNNANLETEATFLYLPEKQLLFIGTNNSGLFVFRKRVFSTVTFKETEINKDSFPEFVNNGNIFYDIIPYGDTAILTSWGIISSKGKYLPNKWWSNRSDRSVSATARDLFLYRRNLQYPITVLNDVLRPIAELPMIESRKDYRNLANFSVKDTNYLLYQKRDTIRLQRILVPKDKLVQELDEFIIVSPLLANSVAAIAQIDVKGFLWLGLDNGLCRVNLKNKTVENVPEFEDVSVRCLYFDSANTVWVGTYGKGWYRYREGQPLFALPMDRNKHLSIVNAFIEDEAGYFWVSTNNGLFRFLKKDTDSLSSSNQPLFYNYFNKGYGFLTNEFNGGSTSVLRLKDGNFVFPTMKGLVVFKPLEVPVETSPNVIFIDDIYVDKVKLPSQENISLYPNFNNLSIRLSMPFYNQPYNIQAEYSISDDKPEWAPLNGDGVITINRMAHGKYTLRIRVLKGYGTAEFYQKNIEIEVRPFWYQSGWFFVLTGIFIIIFTALAFRERLRQIGRRNKQLEELVIERTASLTISEEKLRKGSQFRSKITAMVLHDIRSPIYYLGKLSGNIYNASEGKATEEIREQLHTLYLSTENISAYTQNLLSWINTGEDDFELNDRPVILLDMFMELCTRYHQLASYKENKLTYDVSADMAVMTKPDILEIVLRNLLDNAIKYTEKGSIIITAYETDTTINILVTDTGIGMTLEKLQLIKGSNVALKADSRSGMGLLFVIEMLGKLGGRFDIISVLGKGTEVTVSLPKKDLNIKYDI